VTEGDPHGVSGDDLDGTGGDPACWLVRVCQHCWRFVEEPAEGGACPFCGTSLAQ
jgi:hypothetical protein